MLWFVGLISVHYMKTCSQPFSQCVYLHTCMYAHVYCVRSEPEGCTEGSVRLSGGNIEQEGIPQVCVNGVWGSICDSGWSSIDGLVFCKELGYEFIGIVLSSTIPSVAGFSMARSCLYLRVLRCNSLFNLPFWRWRRSYCLE